MQSTAAPRLIDFSAIGDPSIGFISVAEAQRDLPFTVRRVFWTFGTPEHVSRGRHAHRRTELVLVAAAGRIVVSTELSGGDTKAFTLDTPTRGLYLPPCCWRTMTYAPATVQLALASTDYDPKDYIRDHDEFRRLGEGGAQGT